MTQKTTSRIYYSIVLVLITTFVPSLTWGLGNSTTEYIATNKQSITENDISLLADIPIEELRYAKDDTSGTLYYAGLLWFLNGETSQAIIAWKRSARTGVSPWKEESLRLVGYALIRESRYNQVVPFFDTVTTTNQLIQDPELFTYYTFALWKDKSYEQLKTIIANTKLDQFVPTLRNRVTIPQVEFNITMWKTFLQIQNNNDNPNILLRRLFTQYPIEYMNSNIHALIKILLPRETLDEDILAYLKLHTLYDTDTKTAFNILKELPKEYFQSPWIVIQFIKTVSLLSRKDRLVAKTLLEQLQKDTSDSFTFNILNNAIAELYYREGKFIESRKLYYQTIESSQLNSLPYEFSHILSIAQWRYLYSIIQDNTDEFLTEFLRITKSAHNPEYFSNLLEELLSKLLQKQQWDRIQQYYDKYHDKITNPYHQIEILRWQSILSRIEESYTIDFSLIHTFPIYHSDIPFDYFINEVSNITKDTFFAQWVPTHTPTSIDTHPVNTFIKGYIEFGLTDYAYSIALENPHTLSLASIEILSNHFKEQELHSKNLHVIRLVAAKNNKVLGIPDIFTSLYPTLYLDILQTVDASPIEQALLLGLMREESSFDVEIQSVAGAIGLTQLLPATAKDIASRINFTKNIELTNPHDNIILGYHYFIYLIRVLKSPIKAIASYNGGLGNVWKWEEQYSTHDLIIFTDSLPFRETRNYVRKVIASAMIYGLLYFDISPHDFREYLLE